MDPSRASFRSSVRQSFNPRNKAMQRLKRRADNRMNDFSKADFSLDFTRQYNDRAHNETNPDIYNRNNNRHFNKYYY